MGTAYTYVVNIICENKHNLEIVFKASVRKYK